ncbi:hypothetical protein JCM10212_000583 [Sporobolomyces blumeae]
MGHSPEKESLGWQHDGALVPPLELTTHSQGWSATDQIVTDDNEHMMFHWNHHSRFFAWHAELKAGGPDGPLVARVEKPAMSSSFTVFSPDGAEVFCEKRSVMAVTHHFTSPVSNTPYKWKNVGFPGSGHELALVDLTVPGEQKIVATWRSKLGWSSKSGKLRLSRGYLHELELVLSTALAMAAIDRTNRHAAY